MSDPSTLPEWVAHCRTQATAWQAAADKIDGRTSDPNLTGLASYADQCRDTAFDWWAGMVLAECLLIGHATDTARAGMAGALARLAAHLPTTPTTEEPTS